MRGSHRGGHIEPRLLRVRHAGAGNDTITLGGTGNTVKAGAGTHAAYFVDDAATETLSQSIALAAGTVYSIGFDYYQVQTGNPNPFTLSATFGNQPVTTVEVLLTPGCDGKAGLIRCCGVRYHRHAGRLVHGANQLFQEAHQHKPLCWLKWSKQPLNGACRRCLHGR